MVQGRLLITLAIAALTAFAGPAWAAHKPKANDCADPYWAGSLRCDHVAPGEPPQPNLGDAPAAPMAIKPFTRVFLTRDHSIRALDGTLPTIFVDKAICTAPVACGDVPRGEPVESDKWLFTFPGGGSCHRETCLTFYADPAERGEMSTAADPPTKALEGIHTGDEDINPVFAGFNRVRIEKSSFDRYMGRASHELEDGSAVIHNHGWRMVEAALDELRNGLRYRTWVERDGAVVAVTERLPALAKAEQVVFAGHSGGSHGLLHNLDNLAALLDDLGGFDGDVRAVFDENFIPGAEAEAAFALPPAGDAYSGVWSGTTSGGGTIFGYDGEAFARDGVHAEQYGAWDALMDASCLSAHPGGEAWRCNDRHHVLFNHIETPFLVKQDLRDPNPEHNNRPFGHRPQWAQAGGTLTPPEFAARVVAQAHTLVDHARTRSELGAAFPTFWLWIPECATHAGLYDDPIWFGSRIGVPGDDPSLREWVERFVASPRSGSTAWRIHGEDGRGSACPA